MAIEAEAPDGTVLEFPDGTPDDVIDRTMREHIKKTAPPPQPTTGIVDDIMQGPVGQAGLGTLEGLTSLPGLPVEAGVLLGNVANYATGKPWRSLEEDPNLKDWGARGWQEFAQRNLGVPQGPAPQGEIERVARKAGNFAGGALPFGPAGMVPTLSATAGSEVGRATDQAGVTGGYGELAGAVLGGAAHAAFKRAPYAGETVDSLRALKDEKYRLAEQSGVIVTQQAMRRLADDIEQTLAREAYHPRQHPNVAAALSEIRKSGGGNATLEHVDKVLRGLSGNAAQSIVPKESRLGSMVVEKIDDFLDNLQGNDTLAGNAPEAIAALKDARSAVHRMRKAELLEQAIGKAEGRAKRTGIGGNIDNTTRQNIGRILDNPKLARNFTPYERKLMRKVADGTPIRNLLRGYGGFAPQKGFLPATLAALLGGGAVTGTVPYTGPIAAFLGGAAASKQIADSMTKASARRLVETALQGGKELSSREAANQLLLEMQRRARLARSSALKGTTGAPAALQDRRTRPYPEAPEGYPYVTAPR